MKPLRLSAIAIISIIIAAFTVRAESTNIVPATDNADRAWRELQQLAVMPQPPAAWQTNSPADEQQDKFDEQVASAAKVAAEESKNYYTRYPGSSNAIPARILQCKMLQTAFTEGNGDQSAIAAWRDAQESLLAQPELRDEDRFDLRMAILLRKRMDPRVDWKDREVQRETDLRALIKDYPQKEKPYESLLNLAANSAEAKARAISSEILAHPVSEKIKIKAEGILRRLDAAGKPPDIAFTALDGRKVDLSRMRGKVVLVDFWATWCGPCVGEIPGIKATYDKYHAQGFEVVGISLDSAQKDLERYVKKNQLPWPQYFDGKVWDNKFAIQYGIAGIPEIWLVDKTGNLRDKSIRGDFHTQLEKLLAE